MGNYDDEAQWNRKALEEIEAAVEKLRTGECQNIEALLEGIDEAINKMREQLKDADKEHNAEVEDLEGQVVALEDQVAELSAGE